MVQHNRFQMVLAFGLIAVVLIEFVHSEKPDTTRILTRHLQYRSLTQGSDMIKMVGLYVFSAISSFFDIYMI